MPLTIDVTRQCPECRQTSLRFSTHYPVLTPTTALMRTGTDSHNGPDRLQYASGWICQNPRCDYRDIIEDA